MAKQTITVPDIGGAEDTEVIELCVAVGDRVEAEQSLIVLESDKASMEIPASVAGIVVELLVKEGDSLAEGDPVLVVETEAEAVGSAVSDEPAPEVEKAAEPEQKPEQKPEPEPAVESATTASDVSSSEQVITVPDIGAEDAVEVIEISVAVGDSVEEGDSLLVLESDKATMEIPSPAAGELLALLVNEGDQVRSGDAIATLKTAGQPVVTESKDPAPASVPASAAESAKPEAAPAAGKVVSAEPALASAAPAAGIYAGPAVRKLAREFGIELAAVRGSGPRGRIVKEDLQEFVKKGLSGVAGAAVVTGGAGIPAVPVVDFAQFGEVDIQPLSKIGKLTAANMQRSWLNVPHVTQFEEADVSELEAFRKELKLEGERRGVKLTPLPFILKACAAALRENPRINASLAGDGENIVYKNYVHIGVAVDTPAGLVVPVVRDVDKKGLWELAAETFELAARAKERKLKVTDMQGACFTISSLGTIGGTGFTPIVNAPEVAILGVSRAAVKPVWDGEQFQPRTMLPLALSYDHRVVNGVDGGRFMTQLATTLADIRRLLL